MLAKIKYEHSYSSLVDLLQYRAYQQPKDLAFRFITEKDGIEHISYNDLAIKAQAIAAALQQMGVKPGDRAIIIYQPSIEFITAYFGCLFTGAIAVPVYPPINAKLVEKLQHIIENAQPRIILSTDEIANKIKKLKFLKFAGKIPLIRNIFRHESVSLAKWDFDRFDWLTTNSLPLSLARDWRPTKISHDNIAFLQYTSGSTGIPKGVIVSHGNLLHNLQLISKNFNVQPDSVGVIWLPPYHDMGLIGGILVPVFGGFPTTLMSPTKFLRNPFSWLEAIDQYRATISGGPNFAYDYCVNKITEEQKNRINLSSWSVAFNGAEPIRADTLERFYNYFSSCGFRRESLHPCYGLAETSLLTSGADYLQPYITQHISTASMKKNKLNIVDRLHPEAKLVVSSGRAAQTIKIVNPKTRRLCSTHEIGEIWLHGPSVTHGYWQRPDETKYAFKARIRDDKDENHRYLRTGDLGFIHDGNLYVTGRIKDLIIIHGYHYYPHDIEHTVNHCHPLIRMGQTAAFTIPINDEDHLVIACEVNTNLKNIELENIYSSIKKSVAEKDGLTVHTIILLPPKALPKTATGKIRRQPCRQAWLDGKLKPIYVWNLNSHKPSSNTAAVETRFEAKKTNYVEINQQYITNYIKKHIAHTLGIAEQEIRNDDLLCSIGMDSLKTVELFNTLQTQFQYSFPDDFLAADISIEKIAQYFYEHIKSHPDLEKILLSKPFPTTTNDKQYKTEKYVTYTNDELAQSSRLENYSEFRNFIKTKNLLKDKIHSGIFFNIIEDTSRDTITINGTNYINFSGYNYLGLSGDPKVSDEACNAIMKYGTSVSASRIVSGQKPIHAQLEKSIADLLGTDDSIVYTAGYGTNVAAITALFDQDDLIVHDELSHNSLIHGAIYSGAKRLSFPHNDYAALDRILSLNRSRHKKALIITEGVFSMDGDIPDVPKLIALKKRYHAFLMIDEAHSMGVIGKTGRGIREYFNLAPNDIDIWMGTLSKSFASCGGYIAGTTNLIEFLKFRSNGFIFSAGITPANTAAALAAINLMKASSERVTILQQRSKLFLDILRANHVNTGLSNGTPIIPVIVGRSDLTIALSENLRRHNIYVLPIIYPAVAEQACRIRFFINCLHSVEQITYSAEMTAKEYNKLALG